MHTRLESNYEQAISKSKEFFMSQQPLIMDRSLALAKSAIDQKADLIGKENDDRFKFFSK